MKKFIFGAVFGLLLVFSSAKVIKADCLNKPLFGCSSGYSQCGDGNTCCASAGECGQYPSSQTTVDIHGSCGETGISTAIGCINFGDQNAFLASILRWAVGIGGGLAFLLIVYAGFMIMTASGDPERLKAGQELLTSAISGLILLVFSIFILNFIGVDILGLNRFGF